MAKRYLKKPSTKSTELKISIDGLEISAPRDGLDPVVAVVQVHRYLTECNFTSEYMRKVAAILTALTEPN
ncbi:hypothetical protein [Listeria booriae]|uniref:hypothetical protein n=1 Tax=Listeria booriae TaxID=1552123 RepID=UPI001628F604|nr:hypothetical protein [Listeria booriae]MBC2149532.1 hypothetical protein [Listeria booriae]